MIAWLLTPLGRVAVGAVASAAALTGVYTFGYSRGHSAGKVEQLQAAVAAYQKREEIDANVSRLDRVGLFVELGGLLADCEQLRALEAAPNGQ